jgi:molybdopterin-containing oxidoreductase family iron-sulfur binding subunit
MKGCKVENNTPEGVHWNYVFRYAEEGETEASNYMPRPCQHCSRPTCTYVCPTEARHKRDDGIVVTDYDQCVGCRYCQVACPYGVNFFQWGRPSDYEGFEKPREDRNGRTVAGDPPGGVMGKCTFCVHRQDSGDPELEGTTACAEACPWGTISFGDLNDPEDDPRKHLAEKSGSHTFQLLESVGNGPSVIYIGPEPSSDATSGEGTATTFEEMGFVDCRREVLDDRAPGRKTGGESHE